MSRENVELVRRGYEAMDSGDLETVLAGFDQDIEFVLAKDDAETVLGLDFKESYSGIDGFMQFLAPAVRGLGGVPLGAGRIPGCRRPSSGLHPHDRQGSRERDRDRAGHGPRVRGAKRKGRPARDFLRPRQGPRSRGAAGVGDVAGERGAGARDLRRGRTA